MKKLFLIDAFALIYRAFFAFNRQPIVNSKGLNTSAIFGFLNTLVEILQKEKPDYFAVAFDSPELSQRSENFLDYKAHRAPMPEGIGLVLPYCYKMLNAMGIVYYAVPGYEADDLIGTMALHLASSNLQVFMVTPDKDYGQLVSENALIYRPKTGGGYEILGVKEVCEKFQIKRPDQVADLLGLWGDASDNIPGIPGVGEKTAQKLLAQYDNLETVLQYARVQKGKLSENLLNFADQGRISKALATIITEVPFEYHLEEMKKQKMDLPILEELLKELEFKTLGKRILSLDSSENSQISLSSAEKTLKNTPHSYQWIETETERQKLINLLKNANIFCMDTETTSLQAQDAELVVLSFSVKKNEAFCIYFDENEEKTRIILQEFNFIFQNPNKILVGQNIKFDYKILLKYGIKINNIFWDTMLAHYLLFPEKNHNLNLLSEQYLNYLPIPIEDLIGKKGKDQKTMRQVEKSILLDYSAEDVDITLQLYEILNQELTKNNNLYQIFKTIEMPLIPILGQMEWEGILLDVPFLKHYGEKMGFLLQEIQQEIFTDAGLTWNLDSPKQLGEVLFEQLKISSPTKKTKTGQYATSEEELSKIDHPLVKKILKYRGLKKLQSTYIESLPQLVHPKTGRIHTSFLQTGTVTGRLSSKDPNLQNIPIKTEQGKEIRRAFIAKKNYVLLAADYSQIELRILAALSQDSAMLLAFANQEDIHQATASKIYKIPLNEVTNTQRRNAKAVNFGIIYGQTPFGLSQTLGISAKEAKEIIDAYFTQYPSIQAFMKQNIEQAKTQSYVTTLLGRQRNLPDIHSANHVVRSFAERNAINSPIQGTAADLVKLAMIKIQEKIETEYLPMHLVLQVHDELLFEVEKNSVEEMQKIIKNTMENAYHLNGVDLIVDIGVADNWLDAH